MLIAFQVILLIIMVLSMLWTIGEAHPDYKSHSTSILIASILAMLATFWV